MRIRRLTLANFRSVAEGRIIFPGHTVIIGGNSVGKSTMCEALDLLLGPDRLSRRSPIDEHDFFERRYLDDDGVPIPIELEVVLTDLTDAVLTRFRTHREYWNTATNELLDETATPEDVDSDDVVPALRIKFEGVYDAEEDEFRAETYFASPPPDDETRRAKVSRTAKRQFRVHLPSRAADWCQGAQPGTRLFARHHSEAEGRRPVRNVGADAGVDGGA